VSQPLVPFERLAAELQSLYGPVHEHAPRAVFDGEGLRLTARYNALLADAAAMLDVACPPMPFTRADRSWLEEALVAAGLDVRSPSARG